MRTFIYKSFIVAFLAIIVFKFTISKTIQSYEKTIWEFFKRKIEFYKIKIRDEMKNAIEKDNYLDREDAKLIREFIDKVKAELSSTNTN